MSRLFKLARIYVDGFLIFYTIMISLGVGLSLYSLYVVVTQPMGYLMAPTIVLGALPVCSSLFGLHLRRERLKNWWAAERKRQRI